MRYQQCFKIVISMLATNPSTGYITTYSALPIIQTHKINMPRYSPSSDGILHQIDGSDDQMRIQYAYLQQFRQAGDPHMDNIISLAKDEQIISKVTVNYMQKAHEMRIDQRSPAQQQMAELYDHYSQVPSWVDFEQLQRGIDVFFKYLPAISTSLFFRSLITGFSYPGITEVLKETAYLGKNSKRSGTSNRRLLDTITYVTTNMISAESLKAGGEAWKWGLEVRVIHAKVRHRLLNNKHSKWDTSKNGIPINPEDMSATLLGFSQAAIQRLDWILPIMTSADKADYIALWRYIGWLVGIDTRDDKMAHPETTLDPLGGSTKQIELINACISRHLIQTTDDAKKMTKHILSSVIGQDKEIPYKFLSVMSHNWLGKDFASALDIPETNNLLLRAMVVGHINVLRLYMIAVTKFRFLGQVAMSMNRRLTLVAVNAMNERRGFRRSFLDNKRGETSRCPMAKFISS